MSFLPTLGTTYPSLAHFKFDIYTRAGSCTASVYCRRRHSDGSFEVVSREEKHTCDAWERTKDPVGQKLKMLIKVNETVKEIAEAASRKGASDGHSSGKLSRRSNWDEEENSAKNRKGGKRRRINTRRQHGNEFQLEFGPLEEGRRTNSDTSYKKFDVIEGYFPSPDLLQDSVDNLKSMDLPLPLPWDWFPTLDEILARLYAFSQQQGVLLERCIKTATSTHKELFCSHNYREYEVVQGGRCPVVYRIDRAQDGNWSLAYPVQPHSHLVYHRASSPSPVAAIISSSTSSQPSPLPNETFQLPRSSFSLESSTLAESPPADAFRQPPTLSQVVDRDTPPKPFLPPPPPPLDPPPRRSISPEVLVCPPTSTESPTSKRELDDPLPPSPVTKSPRLSPPKQTEDQLLYGSSALDVVTRMEEEEEVLQEESLPLAVDSQRDSLEETSLLSSNCSPSTYPSTSTSLSSSLSAPFKSLAGEKAQDELPSIELSTFLRNFNLQPDKLASILSDLNATGCNSLETFVTLLSIEHSPTFDRWAQALEEETRNLVNEFRKDLEEFDKEKDEGGSRES